MLKKIILSGLLAFYSVFAFSQVNRPNEGYVFSSPIPEGFGVGFDKWIFQSSYSTCVQLVIPSAQIDTTLFLTRNQVRSIRVDSLAGINSTIRFDSIYNIFAFVRSQYPITITKSSSGVQDGIDNRREKSLYPTNQFTTASILLHGRYNNPADGNCVISVHSNADDNLISFKPYHPLFFEPTNDTSKYFATRTKTGQVVLDSGETVILEYHVWNDMYLGANKTVITSTKPHIANIVDAGNLYNQYVPAYPCSPINLIVSTGNPRFQNRPLELAATYYPFSPINKQGKDYIHLLATQPNTNLFYNGQFVTTLDSLELWDTCFYDAGIISTDKPIMFGQFVQRNAQNAQPYEMFGIEVQTSDTSEYIQKTIFDATQNTLIGDTSAFRLNIIAYTQDTALLKHNGATLQNVSWQAFSGNPNLSWCTYQVTDGTHILESTSKFSALYYPQRYIKNPYRQEELSSYMLQGVTPTQEAADSVQFYFLNQNGQKEPWADGPVTACAGTALTLYPNIARHTTWQWAFGDGTTQNQRIGNQRAKPISHTWQSPGQYWVAVTDSAGCSQGDSLLVIVKNGPTAAFSYTANTGCSGTFVQLQNESMGATSYQWYWPGGSSTANNPSFVYTWQDTTVEVTLIATDGNCADTATQNLKLLPIAIGTSNFKPEDIPNVFSPNNDGINDAFCIPGTTGFADCYKLEIFNRWGSLVYSAQNPQDCWQPTNIAAGVYFYVLTLGQQKYSGQVTVF